MVGLLTTRAAVPATNVAAYIVATIGALGGLAAAYLTYRANRKQKTIDTILGERQLLADEWTQLRAELRGRLDEYRHENEDLKRQVAALSTEVERLRSELEQSQTDLLGLRRQLRRTPRPRKTE